MKFRSESENTRVIYFKPSFQKFYIQVITKFFSLISFFPVETLPEILDCLCVPQYGKDKDERVVLFLKVRDGCIFNQDLVSKVRKIIERDCSYQHVPEVVLEVKDILYNLTGKRTEVIVKKIINNLPHSVETIRNPEALQYYYNIPELKGF
ncbi:acetoacetyl-CoA synthetase [Nephila pilipes]|uniref:Acetoacetyl-CoA synthetase n=1 Tax=Nephila pilipes TaxID=299642 RepID=A0A8X6UV71_NEPPI|nr:acetoacetyl-CoA synthetase [Nephila pilipes]